MPDRPPQRCTSPGCHRPTDTGRCDRCRARLARTAPSTAQPYKSPEWRTRRMQYLADNPRCACCRRMAQVPDHYPLSRKTLVLMGVHDPDADEYLRPLCKRCHDRETAVHQPGGWHRDRDR